ncbi:prolyl oligopeptidase family serine peptidase [Pseudoalteromonas sp. L21]|uniref:alpha/beta hydrolase family protein n=1 Tax=Pseudoalteromonas sp. L21 TaxID=1539746 RepID=UPI001F0176AF|nr:prolyl oligopeptidase family serine peptidase [Pseudoalteromonas sp. L21]MCF7520097.1 prolyl oligopeptidase family serine peptidase [Pseudoalteromonas sp. L21]
MNRFLIFIVLLLSFAIHANTDENRPQWESYIDSTTQENVSLSPNGEQALFLHQIRYPSIHYVSQARVQLAGLDFYSNLYSRFDTPLYSHTTLFDISNRTSIDLTPDSGVIIDYNWSPDVKKIAYLIQNDNTINLWVYDVETQVFKRLSQVNLSASLGGRHLRWLPDSTALIVKKRNTKVHSPINELKQPNSLSSERQVEQGRTYQSLLKNNKLKEQFKTLALSSLVKIDLKGNVTSLTDNMLFDDFSVSPDGEYVLSSTLPKELSSYLPYKKWGRDYQVTNLKTHHQLNVLPSLNNKVNLKKAKDSVPNGARLVKWLPSEGSTLTWTEAIDNGDMSVDKKYHDNTYKLPSPFNQNKQLIHQAKWRVHNIIWGKSGAGVAQEWLYASKQAKASLISASTSANVLIEQRDYRDKFNDFGDPQTLRLPEGYEVLVEDDSNLLFLSNGLSKEGIRPTIKTLNKTNNTRKEYFISSKESIELPLRVANNTLIIQTQNVQTAPQYFAILSTDMNERIPLLTNKNKQYFDKPPTFINYKRSDGLNLSGTLHLPSNYDKAQGKIPAVLWIYPDEFNNKKLSQQNTVKTNIFRQFDPLSPLVFLHDGIAVFESPSMPITAFDGQEPNDDFINQINLNAQAAINALEGTGLIDIDSLAVMGHSYGAFTVANLLAHTDFFKAGIARSGAYNRTLTPFGFQGEKRTLWQAKKTYIDLSPIMFADKINAPLLLIHGENDQNSGTYPLQSTRMYQALIANKKTTQLIMLPYEGHSYRAKENLTYLLKEQSAWLNKWLKSSRAQL